MNYLTSLRALTTAGLLFAAPAVGFADSHHHDDHHDSGHSDHHGDHNSHGSYGHGYGYGHSSYGHSYGYGYRPYYGGGYYRSYPSYRPSVSFGFYSSPSYYGSSYYDDGYYSDSYPTRTVYRGVVRPSYSDRSSSDDLAVDVQRALARRGYYRGGIDGDVGPGTRAAIRAYQYNRGLTVTGRIDSSLVRSLGLS